jgi:hypothetical protein
MPESTTVAMSDAEYRAHMNALAALVRVMRTLPVDALLDIVQRCETVAPLLEPTAYMRGGSRRLDEQRRLLTAARDLVRVAEAIGRENGVNVDD